MVPAHRQYRPDIDGLRTLAVLPVVFFHAGFAGFSGGFVGVDIFFVISGFLITQLLLKDSASGHFSIVGFYDRRIRRIFPALFLVIAATLAAGMLVLLPSELIALGRSAMSATAFYSNFYAWSETRYFGGQPFENPLLHTWSLAVEEQFYIAWPLVIAVLAGKRWRSFLLPATLFAAITSLALAVVLVDYSQKTAFYMFPPRAWELFLGAILAIGTEAPIPRRSLRQVASAMGTILVLAPVFIYDERTPFPGLAAIPPCLGAALVIWGNRGQDTLAYTILSLRPLVAIGLISYSLYLWHWPIFAIYRLHTGKALTTGPALVLTAASIMLAWLSWRFVERPFRRRHERTDRRSDQRKVILGGLTAMGVTILACLGLISSHGLPSRLPQAARLVDQHTTDILHDVVGCIAGGDAPITSVAHDCIETSPSANRAETLIWGDSHARAYALGLQQRLRAEGHPLLVLVRTGCIPLPGAKPLFLSKRSSNNCRDFASEALQTAASLPHIRTVVLAARWDQLGGIDVQSEKTVAPDRWVTDSVSSEHSIANTDRAARAALMRTASELQRAGKTLVIMLQAPSFPAAPAKCVARSLWHGSSLSRCETNEAQLRAQRAPITAMMQEVAARYGNVVLVDPLPRLCPAGRCIVTYDGESLYRDEHHLTAAGSRYVSPIIPVG